MEDREEKELEKIDSPVFEDLKTEEGTLADEALDSVAGGELDGGHDTVYATTSQQNDVTHNDATELT